MNSSIGNDLSARNGERLDRRGARANDRAGAVVEQVLECGAVRTLGSRRDHRARVVGQVDVVERLPCQDRGNPRLWDALVGDAQAIDLVRHRHGAQPGEAAELHLFVIQHHVARAHDAAKLAYPVPVIVDEDKLVVERDQFPRRIAGCVGAGALRALVLVAGLEARVLDLAGAEPRQRHHHFAVEAHLDQFGARLDRLVRLVRRRPARLGER
jgi:hypothetical protein